MSPWETCRRQCSNPGYFNRKSLLLICSLDREVYDLSTTAATRKGSGTFFQVNGTVGPVALAYATVKLKSDYFGGTCTLASGSCIYEWTNNAVANQKGNVVTAIYRSGPIALGAAYARNEVRDNAAISNRTERASYNLSGAYTMGKNTLALELQTGGDYSTNGVKKAETGLTGTVLAWDYAFSKRTNVGITHFILENDKNSNVGPFYSTSNTFGGQFGALAGEKYTVTAFVLRHSW